MSTVRALETRVQELELKVAQLENLLRQADVRQQPWWEKIYGAFANDPAFDEAMRLGHEYRESLRPKKKRNPKRAAKTTHNGKRSPSHGDS